MVRNEPSAICVGSVLTIAGTESKQMALSFATVRAHQILPWQPRQTPKCGATLSSHTLIVRAGCGIAQRPFFAFAGFFFATVPGLVAGAAFAAVAAFSLARYALRSNPNFLASLSKRPR